jgi:hypothetical protein
VAAEYESAQAESVKGRETQNMSNTLLPWSPATLAAVLRAPRGHQVGADQARRFLAPRHGQPVARPQYRELMLQACHYARHHLPTTKKAIEQLAIAAAVVRTSLLFTGQPLAQVTKNR